MRTLNIEICSKPQGRESKSTCIGCVEVGVEKLKVKTFFINIINKLFFDRRTVWSEGGTDSLIQKCSGSQLIFE